MADDDDRPPEGTVPVRRSLKYARVKQPLSVPPGTAETVAGDTPVVVTSKTPVKRKIATKNKRIPRSENEESPTNSAHTPTSRFDSSLARITKGFLELLDNAPDTSLDLKETAEALKVPRRRLYDITSVLEGIGLIEKKSKSVIRWRNQIQVEANSEFDASVIKLKASIEDSISKEHNLDKQISEMEGRIKKFFKDENTEKLLFLTDSDLKGLPCFENQTIIVVNAPQGTTLEVPDHHQGSDGTQRRYRFVLRSNAGPIEVHLVSKLEDFNGTAENSMACLGANMQSENIQDHKDYWLSSDPGFSICDLWDPSPEIEWDHFLASDVLEPVPQGRGPERSKDLVALHTI